MAAGVDAITIACSDASKVTRSIDDAIAKGVVVMCFDIDQPVSQLSIAQEQMVQIAAAVGLGAKVLVFDEPTSSLGPGEVDRLFDLGRLGVDNDIHVKGLTRLAVHGTRPGASKQVLDAHRIEAADHDFQELSVIEDISH